MYLKVIQDVGNGLRLVAANQPVIHPDGPDGKLVALMTVVEAGVGGTNTQAKLTKEGVEVLIPDS